MLKNSVDISKGFVDAPLPEGIDLVGEILRLKRERRAVILAHYYTTADVQDIADFVGDSLALSQYAATTDADVILFAGVHFMAETAKVLCPDKTVLIPDANAGCSLADSCPADEFAKFIEQHPGHVVISYVNTSVGVKALTDICCTSSNALKVVASIPPEQPIIFGPDRNLGNYIKSLTNRENMLIWQGACHVHEQFSLEKILELREANPTAKIVAHPECRQYIIDIADFTGSTAAIIEFCKTDSCQNFIVVTESGILHKLRAQCPSKSFIPAPPTDESCSCNDCAYMKMITLKKIFLSLTHNAPQIELDENIRQKAEKSIVKMLSIQ